MKITQFNYPNIKLHYFKVVLDGNICQSSTDVSVTYTAFKQYANTVDFSKEFHDLAHIEVYGDSEVILQSIYVVSL